MKHVLFRSIFFTLFTLFVPFGINAQTFGDPFQDMKHKLWVYKIEELTPNRFTFNLLDSSKTFQGFAVPQIMFTPDSQNLLFENIKEGEEAGTFRADTFVQLNLKTLVQKMLPKIDYNLPVPYQNGFTITDRDGEKTALQFYDAIDSKKPPKTIAEIPMNIGEYLWLNEHELVFTDLIPDATSFKLYFYNIQSKKQRFLIEAGWIQGLQKVPGSNDISFTMRLQRQSGANLLQVMNPFSLERKTTLQTPSGQSIWHTDGKRIWASGGLSNLYILHENATEWTKVTSFDKDKIQNINRMEISPDGQYLAIIGQKGAMSPYPFFINESLSAVPLEKMLPPSRLDSLATIYMPLIETATGATFKNKPSFSVESKTFSGMLAGYNKKQHHIVFYVDAIQNFLKELNLPKSDFDASVQIFMLHELTHAIQYQYKGTVLDSTDIWERRGSEKAITLRSIVEGHATFVETQLAKQIGQEKLSETFKNYSVENVRLASGMGAKQLYYDGRNFVAYHFKEGGNERVWSLFTNPPISFQTIANPELYGNEKAVVRLDMKEMVGEVLKDFVAKEKKATFNQEMSAFDYNNKFAFLPEDKRLEIAGKIRQGFRQTESNLQENTYQQIQMEILVWDETVSIAERKSLFEQSIRAIPNAYQEIGGKAEIAFEMPQNMELPFASWANITTWDKQKQKQTYQKIALGKEDLYLEFQVTNLTLTPQKAEAIFNDIWARYQQLKR